MTSEEKDKIINTIYYNESGYGSVKTTYSEARLKSSKLELKYVGTKAQPHQQFYRTARSLWIPDCFVLIKD